MYTGLWLAVSAITWCPLSRQSSACFSNCLATSSSRSRRCPPPPPGRGSAVFQVTWGHNIYNIYTRVSLYVSSSPPPPWYSISLICIHDEMMHHHTLPFNAYPGMKYNKLTAIISQIMKHFWVPEPLSLVRHHNASLCYFQFRAPLLRSVIPAPRPQQQSGHTPTSPGPRQVRSK